MTQWNEFVKEFAEKKKIAYGCAIVRNDLRKAYNKEYNPVPRNRGIYGTGKMRKSRRPPTEEEAKQSALKRTASFKKTRDMKEEQAKKADEERQRKFEEELEARFKANEEKEKAEKLAKKKAEDDAKAKAEASAKAEQAVKDREKAKRDARQAIVDTNKANWDLLDNAKDTGGRHDGTLSKIDKLLRKNARENGIGGLYLLLEKEWGADNKRGFIFSGYDLAVRDKYEYGYLKKRDDGSVSLFLSDKAKKDSALRELKK